MNRSDLIPSLLILGLIGCAGSKPGLANTSPPLKHQFTDAEVENITQATIQRIHADLKELKSRYPQLSEIETAIATANQFRYRKGFVKDRKTGGVTFEKEGCDIYVRITYPATSTDDDTQLMNSSFLRLANGKCMLFWKLVRAENTDQASTFKSEVERVLSKRTFEMLVQLGDGPA
ncbi:MAG: hypothetical protein V1809_11935 [Planctomycetota bacterium]